MATNKKVKLGVPTTEAETIDFLLGEFDVTATLTPSSWITLLDYLFEEVRPFMDHLAGMQPIRDVLLSTAYLSSDHQNYRNLSDAVKTNSDYARLYLIKVLPVLCDRVIQDNFFTETFLCITKDPIQRYLLIATRGHRITEYGHGFKGKANAVIDWVDDLAITVLKDGSLVRFFRTGDAVGSRCVLSLQSSVIETHKRSLERYQRTEKLLPVLKRIRDLAR